MCITIKICNQHL